MPSMSQLSQMAICPPCKDGNHYYCVLNERYGLRVVLRLEHDSLVKIESCVCGCQKDLEK